MAILSSHRTGIVNVRDIGGYQAVDGMKVKKELLIRGTSLATAKDADLAQLAALPVVKVIDFRTDFEKKGKENRALPGADYICLPVLPINDGEIPEKMTKRKSFDLSKLIMIAAFNEKAKPLPRKCIH